MNIFCIIISALIIIILIDKLNCLSHIKKWCNFSSLECMFNEDKLFKRDIYGNGYIIGYDKCK